MSNVLCLTLSLFSFSSSENMREKEKWYCHYNVLLLEKKEKIEKEITAKRKAKGSNSTALSQERAERRTSEVMHAFLSPFLYTVIIISRKL